MAARLLSPQHGALWAFAAWWLSLGHIHYAWDEALWILGFVTIEANMGEWKNEIEHEQANAAVADQLCDTQSKIETSPLQQE
jgi:hypothetical protein